MAKVLKMRHHVMRRLSPVLGVVLSAIEVLDRCELSVFANDDLASEAGRVIDDAANHSLQQVKEC